MFCAPPPRDLSALKAGVGGACAGAQPVPIGQGRSIWPGVPVIKRAIAASRLG